MPLFPVSEIRRTVSAHACQSPHSCDRHKASSFWLSGKIIAAKFAGTFLCVFPFEVRLILVMSESALQKLAADKEAYEAEYKALTEAQKPEAVCAEIVKKINSKNDPLLDPNNPWIVQQEAGCCLLM